MTQSNMPTKTLRRRLLGAGIALPALLAASGVKAEPATPLQIPAGSLENALLAVSAQTHQQVLFSRELVAGRKAAALSGAYTAEEAVHLLAPGIVVTRAGPAVLVLRDAKATQAPRPEVAGQGPFVAEATRPPTAEAPIQTLATAQASLSPNTVSEVEITGSHIRGVQTASPLRVLDRAALERTGQQSLVGALQTLPEVFAGGESEATQATGANTQGTNSTFATGLNLRGLGTNATLVLVDGRRIAASGAAGDFVDISAIPTAIVQRVDVLLDGASALYGSDAVGGVVNVILRRDFDGEEVRLEGGEGTQGLPREWQASGTLGRRWKGGGLLLSYTAQYRSALPGDARDFTSTADLRGLGGTDHRLTSSFPGNILISTPGGLVPSFGIPAGQSGVGLTASQLLPGILNFTNQRAGDDTLPRQMLQSIFLAGDQDLGERVHLSGDMRFSYRDYRLRLGPPTANLTVKAANPFFVSPIGATSETVAYSFIEDLPPPLMRGSAETFTATAGGTVRLNGGWNSSGYVAFGAETDRNHSTGLINSSSLNEALGSTADNPATPFGTARDGFFNPFAGRPGANSATILNFIGAGETGSASRDEVVSANLQADGPVWRLPGGEVKLALGADVRRESLVRTSFNFVSGTAPTPSAPTDLARTVTAAYAELQIPLVGPDNARPGIEALDLSLAGRVEHYPAFGTTANPKFGLLWKPSHDLALRATYGTSFRAPELRELSDPALNAETLLPLNGGRITTLVLTGGNPNLRPETARSWTVGADYKPQSLPGLTLSLTGFDIRFRNRIGRPVAANLVGALTDPTLASFITRISPTTNPADFALITALVNSPQTSTLGGIDPPAAFGAIADERYVNTAALTVSGLDGLAGYAFDLGADRVSLAANATYMFQYDQQLTPTTPTVDEVNVANFPLRFRGRATADWTHGGLTGGLALNYTGSYHDPLGVPIRAQATVDLQLRTAPQDRGPWRGLTATFNVRNLFDRAPPFYNNPFGIGFDPANGDPIGRFVSLQLTRVW